MTGGSWSTNGDYCGCMTGFIFIFVIVGIAIIVHLPGDGNSPNDAQREREVLFCGLTI